jgi:hypothetical protein
LYRSERKVRSSRIDGLEATLQEVINDDPNGGFSGGSDYQYNYLVANTSAAPRLAGAGSRATL